jgi:hypothetical protein
MNSRRWYFLLYLLIAPIIVAVSQATILEFPLVTKSTGAPYNPFPGIFYIPGLIGLILLAAGAMATSILETANRTSLPHRLGGVIRFLSPLIFLFLFWFGVNLAQRSVIVDYVNVISTHQLSLFGMFYLPGLPEIFPKLGFLPFYTAIGIGVIGLLATVIQWYVLFADRR